MHVPITEIGDYIRASKDVLDMLKTMSGVLPKGQQHDAAAKQLATAERALQASEAQLAKALDYNLCQCTFPPQIMLQVGRHAVWDVLLFKCPKCHDEKPSPRHFSELDEARRQTEENARAYARF